MLKEFNVLKDDYKVKVTFYLFIFFTLWRIALFVFPQYFVSENSGFSFAWGAFYQLIALWGGVAGFIVSRSWGGWKSAFGKTIIIFSIGLLFQSLGQMISSYYVFTTGEVPYPSFGDIGFFGSIIFYILGVFLLARVTGIKAFTKSFRNKLQAIIIPVLLLVASYTLFLKDYQYDWSYPLQTFLDFGYPMYQAIYLAIAILVFLSARKFLGGMMKFPVVLLLIALVMQYLSDFVFLYQISRGIYIPEGINDYMYFLSYFLMALALIYTGNTFKRIVRS